MNKGVVVGFVMVFVVCFGVIKEVFATVGGPIFISQIVYNPTKNAIYYLESDNGGRGCPPIIHSIDLTTGQNSEIKTCEQVFEEYYGEGRDLSNDTYDKFVSEFFDGINHNYLGSVSLKKNGIDIKVEVMGENIENGEKSWTDFKATIRQGNKELGKINFRGCDKEQPHIFDGYMIPGSEKMVILLSNKSDCFEGGYLGESVHLISGVKYSDTKIVRSYKDASPSDLNTGNVVVTAADNGSSEEEQNKNGMLSWVVQLGILTMGVFAGFLIGKRSRRI